MQQLHHLYNWMCQVTTARSNISQRKKDKKTRQRAAQQEQQQKQKQQQQSSASVGGSDLSADTNQPKNPEVNEACDQPTAQQQPKPKQQQQQPPEQQQQQQQCDTTSVGDSDLSADSNQPKNPEVKEPCDQSTTAQPPSPDAGAGGSAFARTTPVQQQQQPPRSLTRNERKGHVQEAIKQWAHGNLHELAHFQALTALEWYLLDFTETLVDASQERAGYDAEDAWDDDGLDASGVIELGAR